MTRRALALHLHHGGNTTGGAAAVVYTSTVSKQSDSEGPRVPHLHGAVDAVLVGAHGRRQVHVLVRLATARARHNMRSIHQAGEIL